MNAPIKKIIKQLSEQFNHKFDCNHDAVFELAKKERIHQWLKDNGIYNFKFNEDGTLNCYQDVRLRHCKNVPIPVKFSFIEGSFDCSECGLKNLDFAPTVVSRWFDCSDNELTSLKGGPQHVKEEYKCKNNQLKSLMGAPLKVCEFNCHNNQLEDLSGSPQFIQNSFICSNNQIKSLKGGPSYIGHNFNISNNQLTSLEHFPNFVKDHADFDKNPIMDFKAMTSNETMIITLDANLPCFKMSCFDYLKSNQRHPTYFTISSIVFEEKLKIAEFEGKLENELLNKKIITTKKKI